LTRTVRKGSKPFGIHLLSKGSDKEGVPERGHPNQPPKNKQIGVRKMKAFREYSELNEERAVVLPDQTGEGMEGKNARDNEREGVCLRNVSDEGRWEILRCCSENGPLRSSVILRRKFWRLDSLEGVGRRRVGNGRNLHIEKEGGKAKDQGGIGVREDPLGR